MSAGDLGPWRLVERRPHLVYTSDEGVARFGGRVVYRGSLTVPLGLRLQGWNHIGDPDATDNVLVDCFQAGPGGKGKLYRATGPDGGHADHLHPVGDGELLNNSFVAIAPGARWMISGEWFEMERFLVFAVPSPGDAAELPLAGVLHLDHPVRNVQGAAWIDPLTLLCTTDDAKTDLWPVPRQLLQVTLDAPLEPGGTGRVTCLGPLPLQSRCRGTFEVEGCDYDPSTGDLRVIVTPPLPCKLLASTVYRYRRDG